MRDAATSLQIAILDLKQERAKLAYRQLDQIQREAEDLLEFAPAATRSVPEQVAADHIHLFLQGEYTAQQLLDVLGIRVTPIVMSTTGVPV